VSAAFTSEFAHLRAAISSGPPDWNEIRLVFQLLEPHATTPEMHDALDGLMTASDRASLKLAVNRLEAVFAGASGPASSQEK